MKLELTDTLALLDLLLERTPKTARDGGFSARLQRLRDLVAETSNAEPTFAAITGRVFPGVSENSLRTTFPAFRDALAAAADAAGQRFTLIKPAARNLAPSEIRCHFEGTPLPREKELKEMGASSTAIRPHTPLVRARIAAFNSSELARLIGVPLRADGDGRERLRFFVSYAHKDAEQAKRLLDPLVTDLRLSKRFAYDFWRDHLILPGEDWHEEIQDALRDCDFGLALVSRDFLDSGYIAEHELPTLLSGEKPLIPVAIGLLDFGRHNFRGLDEKQLYRFELRPTEFRCFSECTGQVAEKFVHGLARAIEERAEKAVQARKEAVAVRALAEPELLAELAVENPKFHRAILDIQHEAELRASEAPDKSKPESDVPEAVVAEPAKAALLRSLVHHQLPAEKGPAVAAAAATLNLAEAERLVGKSDADTAVAALERQRTDAVRYLCEWFRDPKKPPFAAVLGEIGSGKTTMLQMLARAVSKDAPHDAPPVFFVDLRDYTGDTDPTLEHLLADQLRRHDTSGKLTVTDLIEAVQVDGALIVFDGLDEKIIPLADGPRQRFIGELFRILPSDAMDSPASSGRGRIIISCRSHYFPSVLALASGFTDQQRAQVNPRDYTACFMLPWNDRQVADYLGQTLGKDRVDGALEIIGSIHNLTDLSRRPYLLSLIVPQLEDLELERAAGRPVNGASLYDSFVDKWLLRDEGKHQFTKEHKRLMMENLAADLWRDNAREWPWARVAAWLDTFLYEHPAVAARYARENVSADILNQDFRTATFFLRPDSSKDGFRFAHTSLLEFFLASRLIKCLSQPSAAAVWDLPMPSLEAFDFAGQLLQTMHRIDCDRALAGLRTLLEDAASPERARFVAFTFLVRAAKQNFPIPATVALQARGFDLTGWDVCGTEKRPLRLAGVDWSGAVLGRNKFQHVEMPDSRWHGANLIAATFRDCCMADADWTGATMIRATFRQVEMPGSHWKGADLRSAEFIGCDLEKAEFLSEAGARTRLEGVRFRACRLTGSSIMGAALEGIRVDLPVWNAATEQHWRETLAAYRPGWTPKIPGVWTPPLATGSTSPAPPIRPSSPPPGAYWSLGHSSLVLSVAFSPDGSRILSGSSDKTVRIWDAQSGACLRVLEGHSNPVWHVAFSPDGRRLLSGSDDETVRVWDARSGACLRVLEGHSHWVRSVAFSPDGGRILSGSYDKTVRVWDAQGGTCLCVLDGHSHWVRSVAFSPDGSRILSGSSDKTVRIWDAQSGACLRVLAGHSDGVWSVTFSPDGSRILSGSEDETVHVWDAQSGVCLRVLEGHSNGVWSVAFSPDGSRILSGSWEKTVRVWDAQSGVCLRVLEGHLAGVNSVAFSPDGNRILSGSWDNTVRVWDAQSGACLRVLEGHLAGVNSVAFSPDGSRILSGSADKTVRVWDAQSGAAMEVTGEDLRWFEKNGGQAGKRPIISLLQTLCHQRADGTELDIAALPDGGYAVLERAPGSPHWRLARGSAECWRYVNYATDDERGRILWSADVLGPIPLR